MLGRIVPHIPLEGVDGFGLLHGEHDQRVGAESMVAGAEIIVGCGCGAVWREGGKERGKGSRMFFTDVWA